MTAQFLSPEWFGQLAARLSEAGPAPEGSQLRLKQVVTDIPAGGEASWMIVLEAGRPALVQHPAEGDATVTLVSSYEATEALASGTRTAAELLSAGEIKLRGDPGTLQAAGDVLAAIASVMAEGHRS